VRSIGIGIGLVHVDSRTRALRGGRRRWLPVIAVGIEIVQAIMAGK
jgi:hypothetical protein